MPGVRRGEFQLVEARGSILVHRCDRDGSTVVAVHNIGDRPRKVTLPAQKDWVELIDLLGTDDREPGDTVTIEPYGFRWLGARVEAGAQRIRSHLRRALVSSGNY
jgi:hypothetical protein